MRLDEDFHVHSTYSDGKGTLQENIDRARARGLKRLACVDHVRADTDWVADFTAEVGRQRGVYDLQLIAGLETKFLDDSGRLDLPANHLLADRLYAADHQLPLAGGCLDPRVARRQIELGVLSGSAVISSLVAAICGAMERHPGRIVVAHMFSALPKAGLSETMVSERQIERIARTAQVTDAIVEFDERWNCPGLPVLRACTRHGVPVVASSDAHMPSKIGKYLHAQRVAMELRCAA